MSQAGQRGNPRWLGDSEWISRWGQCGLCSHLLRLETGTTYGSCMRFELWPDTGVGGRYLTKMSWGRRLGEEVFVQEGHGCPSFQARTEALEGAFLEAFGQVEPGLDAEGTFLRDGHLAAILLRKARQGQEWGEELYRPVWSVLVEKSEPPLRQGD